MVRKVNDYMLPSERAAAAGLPPDFFGPDPGADWESYRGMPDPDRRAAATTEFRKHGNHEGGPHKCPRCVAWHDNGWSWDSCMRTYLTAQRVMSGKPPRR